MTAIKQQIQDEAARLAHRYRLGTLLETHNGYERLISVIILGVFGIIIELPIFSCVYSCILSKTFLGLPIFLLLFVLAPLVSLLYAPMHKYSRSFLYEHGFVTVLYENKQVANSESIHWGEIAAIWHSVSHSTDEKGFENLDKSRLL